MIGALLRIFSYLYHLALALFPAARWRDWRWRTCTVIYGALHDKKWIRNLFENLSRSIPS